MRRPERIDVVLAKMDWQKWVEYWCDEDDWDWIYNQVITNLPNIEKYWKANPDLRLGQMLINMVLFPDGMAWFVEETNWLVEQGLADVDEVNFWAKSYDADGNRLPETIWIPLKDVTPDNAEAILEWFKSTRFLRLPPATKLYLERKTNGNKTN